MFYRRSENIVEGGRPFERRTSFYPSPQLHRFERRRVNTIERGRPFERRTVFPRGAGDDPPNRLSFQLVSRLIKGRPNKLLRFLFDFLYSCKIWPFLL